MNSPEPPQGWAFVTTKRLASTRSEIYYLVLPPIASVQWCSMSNVRTKVVLGIRPGLKICDWCFRRRTPVMHIASVAPGPLPNVPNSSVNTFAAGLGSASTLPGFLQEQKQDNKKLHRLPEDHRTG